jgi:predicted anti-sigma-YlaC factor YlaD
MIRPTRSSVESLWKGAMILCLLVATPACSIKKIAVNKLGNMLASSGSTFTSDDDPELVAAAIPFGLKLYEGLLEESPKHRGLLLAASQGFAEFSYAFVDARIDEIRGQNLEEAGALRERARKLYRRAHGYALRGLEARHKGFAKALDDDAEVTLKNCKKRDAPQLFWLAATLGLEISLSKDKPEMIGQLPLVKTIIARVEELDERYGDGSIPEFMITLTAARTDLKTEDQLKIMQQQFDRAITFSKGKHASAYVSFAENSCVLTKDRAGFQSMLEKALAVDLNLDPDNRLANLVAQRRAHWLLDHINDLFIDEALASGREES